MPPIIVILVAAALISAPFPGRAQQGPDTINYNEGQCAKRGWQGLVLEVGGLQREVLWKGPRGAWTKGAIVVMHGGGGHHFNFCFASARFLEPQIRFTDLALAQGFAVFLLDSSADVTDNEGRVCGKVWDDQISERPNLDLPFIGEVILTTIPHARPPGSRTEIFMTGLSSGGYMTVRASTHFGSLITAFAPISSGDPYGWHRICDKGLSGRKTVSGAGFDNETGKQIIERDACLSSSYPNEKPWEGPVSGKKPTFRFFHHRYDGINDLSCAEKVIKLLREHGYPEVPALLLEGNGRRSLINHLWQADYNRPLLDFFSGQLRTTGKP